MNSLEIINKYSEELGDEPLEIVAEYLDNSQQATALEEFIKTAHARELAKPKCFVCKEKGAPRNKIITMKINEKTYSFHKDCKVDAIIEIESDLGW
jgi:hypothetical protein